MLITAVNAGIVQARLLARTTRWVILLFAVATALVEIGIGRDMVLIAFGVLFGGLVLALALAFGLGGRHLAREILERGRRREREPAPTRYDHAPVAAGCALVCRVEAAKWLLFEGGEKLETVAARVGLHDASHLSRLFAR